MANRKSGWCYYVTICVAAFFVLRTLLFALSG